MNQELLERAHQAAANAAEDARAGSLQSIKAVVRIVVEECAAIAENIAELNGGSEGRMADVVAEKIRALIEPDQEAG